MKQHNVASGVDPYLWPEASSYLGIPDSPTVHLAIRTLADRLLRSDGAQCPDQEAAQIAAMRGASRAVLEGESFDLAKMRFRLAMNLPTDVEQQARAAEAPKSDWLKMARDTILAEGGDPGPDPHQLASRYGWGTPRTSNSE